MRWNAQPLVLPVAALLAGTALGLQLSPAPAASCALLALSLALGRRLGTCLAFGCAGLLLPVLHGEDPRAAYGRLGRATTVIGQVASHWRATGTYQTATVRTEILLQDERAFFQPARVEVSLPAEAAPPALGSRVRFQGLLARLSGYWNRRPTPPGPWRLYVKTERLVEELEPPGSIAMISTLMRQRIERARQEVEADSIGTPSIGMGLARALVSGDSREVPARWKRGLRRWGLSHLLSVSGLHVALLVAAVMLLSAWAPLPWRLALAGLAVMAYLLVLGPIPAAIRAAAMGGLSATALLLRRPPVAANSLAVAAGALTVAQPSLVLDLGFQLTVSATAGLILLAPYFESSWIRLPRWLRRPLAATCAAQLATLPWALPKFCLLSPLAALANLLAVPWASVVLVADFLWTGLALVAPQAARATIPALDLITAPLGWLIDLPPALSFPVPLDWPAWLAWAFTGAAAWVLLRPRRSRLLALGVVILGLGCWPNRDAGRELVMLDVGQGDAFLLRDGRRALLVDGGGWMQGDFGGAVLLPALLGEGVRRLDAVVMTHADSDHCRGLADLLDLLPVVEVWTALDRPAEGCGRDLLAQAPRVRRLDAGDEPAWGQARIRVLHPPRGQEDRGNDSSLVLRLELGGAAVLLTGDIGKTVEARLLANAPDDLAADLLKVAHHGSRSSSTEPFLRAVAPRLALISAGRGNRYGHPTSEVLARLERAGAFVLRSDQHGAVRIELDRPRASFRRPDLAAVKVE